MSFDEQVQAYLLQRREEMIADICTLVRIPSVRGEALPDMPLGQPVAEALQAMAEICAREGFATRVLDNMVGEATFGEGEETLGMLAHMDVVPAGDGWDTPAYEPQVREGRLYGRGTCDDKGPAIAALYAMAALKHAGIVPKRKIKLIFGGAEETGMECIERYLQTEPAPDLAFSPDGPFPVVYAEKHIAHAQLRMKLRGKTALLALQAGTVANAVPGGSTALLAGEVLLEGAALPASVSYVLEGNCARLQAQGVAAHASTPWEGKNAAVAMLGALNEVLPQSDAAYAGVNALYRLCAQWDGAGFGVQCKDESGMLTLNLGLLSLQGDTLQATLDLRLPVTLDARELLDRLVANAADEGIHAEYSYSQGLHVPREHELVQKLMQVYNDCMGTAEPPVAIGGGTYARHLPCAVAFGPEFPGSEYGAHLSNESVAVDELLRAARIYARALAELVE